MAGGSHATVAPARVRFWSDVLNVWTVRGYGQRWTCPNCLEQGTERTKAAAYAALRDHTLEKHAK